MKSSLKTGPSPFDKDREHHQYIAGKDSSGGYHSGDIVDLASHPTSTIFKFIPGYNLSTYYSPCFRSHMFTVLLSISH